ncbi:MAG: DUF2752 domain-containing protein [Ignavibacteriae bacterium]|nr:DUF2752 domain-containing protein [Ignavibacteriota bacterium]
MKTPYNYIIVNYHFINKIVKKILHSEFLDKYFNTELFFWVIALVYLSLLNVETHQYFSFCPFHILGLDWCPGCGLGRSISFLLHGSIYQSFQTHWLGPFAFSIILIRIYQLIRNSVIRNKVIYQ